MGDVHHCPRCELRFQSKWELQDHFDLEHAPHEDAPPLGSRPPGRLEPPAVDRALTSMPGWTRSGDAIERTFELASFPDAIRFVQRIAELAEAADHHPDLDIRYRKVRVALFTHSEGGVTGRDLDLARRIDTAARSVTAS